MKTLKTALALSSLTFTLLLSFPFSYGQGYHEDSIGSNTNTSSVNNYNGEEKSNQDTVIYTCPMHPEIQSDKPGTCPKCGMDLVKKTNASGDQEHKHEMGMMCPMHGMGDMNKSKEKKKIPIMAIGMGIMMGIMMAAMIVYVF